MDFAKQLDTEVPEKLAHYKLPGCAIALIKDGATASVHCYGMADVEKGITLEQDTLFQVASISKAVSAWGVMRLVESGKLDLDAPISRYISRWQPPASEFDWDAVTPRLLLMHYGGTSLSGCGGTPYDKTWYTVEDILYGRTPALDEKQTKYARRWELDPDQYGQPVRLIHEPGSVFDYSGGGFTILELIIEEVSGRSFTDFMGQEILQPLGMNESSFEVQESQLPRVAMPYNEDLEAMPLYRTNGKAAGGMYSTINELARFACAELTGPAGEPPGRGVINAGSIAEMHRPDRYAETQMDMEFYTGLGHYIVDTGDLRAIQHTGGNPGWRSVYTVVPAKKAGFVCLINSAGGNDLWMELIAKWAETLAAGAA